MPERVWLQSCQEGGMVELRPTCDRCGPSVSAAVLYLTAEHELALCVHHDREHHQRLTEQGFERYELTQPVSTR